MLKKTIDKSKIFKDAKKKADENKQKIDDEKDYTIKKNKEMNYTRGKSAKEALEFTLRALNDDIREYNIKVLSLLKMGMKKSQFPTFKVPKPKYKTSARELKNVSSYDPKSYYYSMAVVIDTTFDNLQYSGGTGAGGEVPYIDPGLFTQILNQIFNTQIVEENTRTLDGFLANLREMQNIVNQNRGQLNDVVRRFTSYRQPVPDNDEKEMPELESDPDLEGLPQGPNYSPKIILSKLFFPNIILFKT